MNAARAKSRILNVEEAMLLHEWVRKTPFAVRQFDSEPWLSSQPYWLVMQPCFGSDSEAFYKIFDSYGGVLCAWKTDCKSFSSLAARAAIAVERAAIEEATGPAIQAKRARVRL